MRSIRNPFTATISLDGPWNLSYCDIGAGAINSYKEMPILPYAVPGDVHTPLIENGVIQEPLIGMNDQDCRWMEDKEFWCSRSFSIAAEDIRAQTVLTFEGLDCTADVWLNGTFLGRHSNSFVEVEYDISRLIAEGENTLVVRIDQGLYEVQDKDLGAMRLMWNNEQPYRSYMRKPQYVYGWDWTIWLATCGIWKSVSIRSFDTAWIADVYAYSAAADVYENTATEVLVDVEIEKAGDEDCFIECSICGDARYDDGGLVVRHEGPFSGTAQQLSLTIPKAQLWWSNGLGRQYLYSVEVVIRNSRGEILDTLTRQLGLRAISIEEQNLGNGESTFTFVLNHTRVFCKGANHVPSDCLFGRITAKRDRDMVEMARDANMNMLRIWGGGIYASDAFMEACDRAGIMVWHDFMYACGYYPDYDEAFMANVTDESIRAIRRLRHHASLIGWSGNNEIQGMYLSQKQWLPEVQWHGGKIYEELLPALLKKYNHNIIYRESSPFGGEPPEDIRVGDQHIWEFTHINGHPHYLDLWRFTEFNVKFLSEFGIMGAMNLESSKKCIPPEHLRPDDPVWLHHTNSCQDHRLLAMMVDKYFGASAHLSTRQFILRSQAAQAEITRHIYDEFRCRKFVCSGLLFWTLGDSYGVHNWSLIDYYLGKRPIYHYLKRAMEPVAIAIRGYDVQTTDGATDYQRYWAGSPAPLEIWAVNDTLEKKQAAYTWTLMTLDGRIIKRGAGEAALAKNASQRLDKVMLHDADLIPEQTILYADIRVDGRVVCDSRYFFAPFAKMTVEKADIQYSLRKTSADTYTLDVWADTFVWMLHLETPDGVAFSDNDFDLIPGVKRSVTVTATSGDYVPAFHWVGQQDE